MLPEFMGTHFLFLLALLLVFIAGLLMARSGQQRGKRRRGRLVRDLGLKAEAAARSLLEQEGFQVIDHAPLLEHQLLINGEAISFLITPDLIVEKDEVIYVVEVKREYSGISNAGVRRQVLEYLVASGYPCLLVTMPEGELDLIELLIHP